MFAVNYRELRQMYDAMGGMAACEQIRDWMELHRQGQPGGLNAGEFSIRDLAEALVPDGREWVRSLQGGDSLVMESAGAVDTTAFANISGQIAYTFFMAGYENPAYKISALFRDQPTRFASGEKIPGTTGLSDADATDEVIKELGEYPRIQYGEDWITMPDLEKRGFIIPISRETVWQDRTGLFQRDAQNAGDKLRLRKEKRCVDVFIGAVNPYVRQGTAHDTYQPTSPWINSHANEIADWRDIDDALQLFANMKDPNTDEPIVVMPTTIVCVPGNLFRMRMVVNATEVRTGDGASVTPQTVSANPVGSYNIIDSTWVYNRLQAAKSVTAANAAKYWYIGDPSKAFVYMQGWPVTVTQAPQNSEAELTRDIVLQFKASEYGVPAVLDPRYMVQNTNA